MSEEEERDERKGQLERSQSAVGPDHTRISDPLVTVTMSMDAVAPPGRDDAPDRLRHRYDNKKHTNKSVFISSKRLIHKSETPNKAVRTR